MNRRSMKMLVVVASVAGLTGLATATASAESFTPAIEEPTLDLGFGEDGGPLTRTPDGGSSPDGNYSSAEGRDGTVYGDDPFAVPDDGASTPTYGDDRPSSSDDDSDF